MAVVAEEAHELHRWQAHTGPKEVHGNLSEEKRLRHTSLKE